MSVWFQCSKNHSNNVHVSFCFIFFYHSHLHLWALPLREEREGFVRATELEEGVRGNELGEGGGERLVINGLIGSVRKLLSRKKA